VLTFPTLKTGAATQYPLQTSASFGTSVLKFLGGDEQRFRVKPGDLRLWVIQLAGLSEDELSQVESFFVAATGAFATFSFTDPATGTIYPSCHLGANDLSSSFSGDLRAGTSLVIQQGRD
jgi:hypothetical protein